MGVDRRMRIALRREPLRDGPEREVGRVAVRELLPADRRRHPGVRLGPDRAGRAHGAILRVLVVVDEDAVTLLLPPGAGGETGHAAFDVARQRERRAAHFVEAPAALDAHQHMHSARAGRLRPAGETEVVQCRVDDLRDLADLGPFHARHRIEVDAQLVGMIERLRADRMRMQLQAGEVRHPGEVGGSAWHHLLGAAAGREADRGDLHPIRPLRRGALLEEELAVDAVRVAHQHAGPPAGATQGRVSHRDVVIHQVQLGDPGIADQQLPRMRDDDLAAIDPERDVVVRGRHGSAPIQWAVLGIP